MLQVIMKEFRNTINVIFVNTPGIKGSNWPKDILRRFYNTVGKLERPEDDYTALALNGTTFSGLSFRTTFGNTLRSLAYAYACIERAGFPSPWSRSDIFVIAAGDDLTMWCLKNQTQSINRSILSFTARDQTA